MSKISPKISEWAINWTSVTAEGLAMLRIFTSLFILFFLIPGYGVNHYSWLASLPSDLFSPPPGPMMLFDSFPSLSFFLFINGILILSLAGMLAGYKTRLSSVVAGLTILILQGWVYSIGKTNHEILIAIVPLVMAFSNWGKAYSVDSYLNRNIHIDMQSWPIPFLAVIIGFMMFTAGFPKILGGWLDPGTQAAYGHLLNQYFIKERTAFLAEYLVQFGHPVFWEILDWATILFETCFIAAVFKKKWFNLFICFAVLFHFFTMLSLNIAFVPNFLGYALFLNWDRITHFQKNVLNVDGYQIPAGFGLFLILIFSIVKWVTLTDFFLAESELLFYEVFTVLLSVIIVISLAISFFLPSKVKV